jgi:hypothetical protein
MLYTQAAGAASGLGDEPTSEEMFYGENVRAVCSDGQNPRRSRQPTASLR